MSKGIFVASTETSYDDLPEVRYHFPHTYIQKAKDTVDDWIIYYEPRRNQGRQAYFATARVTHIEPDLKQKKHYYAYLRDYLEFANPVPFREGKKYYESALVKSNGKVNLGLFQRSIHLLPEDEYEEILKMGMSPIINKIKNNKKASDITQEVLTVYERPKIKNLITRPYRDRAFRHTIRLAYNSTCSMTGLNLINGEGHCEIEAAHIRPVPDDGPDSPRNGIALCRTIHWMFDRGILSLKDNGSILIAEKLMPESARRLLNSDGLALLPHNELMRPHPQFLEYHRNSIFKG
jgi:putative restriction endonuclease